MSEGTLRIEKIKFRTGKTPLDPPLEVNLGTVTVLVGPNNAGKSLALREIEDWCFGRDQVRKVVDTITVDFPQNPDTAEQLMREFETQPLQNEGIPVGGFFVGQHTFRADSPVRRFQVETQRIRNAATQQDISILRGWLLASYTVRFDGRTRFLLTDPKPTGDLLSHPQNHLWALFQDDDARRRVRELTVEAFGLHFVIDPTAMTQFRVRMRRDAPKPEEEQSLNQQARNFHRAALQIQDLSDGVQAFVGLVSAVMSLPHKIILIDEPEAFLHPPLARRLGANLTRLAQERKASLVVATHSPEFLIGCLETSDDLTVVRLTYEQGIATARTLSAATLSTMMKDPLLRSTGVLRALFHRAATVTESDTDRAFYDEINRRLLAEHRGVMDAVFICAQNSQTVRRIVGPLREIGIPAAAIVDLDVILDNSQNWSMLLLACESPSSKGAEFESVRLGLRNEFAKLGTAADIVKSRGVYALTPPARDEALEFLRSLADFGLFLVPVGELERWLPQLKCSGHGPDWLVEIFGRMGLVDTDPGYLKPLPEDVWAFLDTIGKWSHKRITGN